MKIHYAVKNMIYCNTHRQGPVKSNQQLHKVTCKHCAKQLHKYYIQHKCYHKAKTAIEQYIKQGGKAKAMFDASRGIIYTGL